MRKVYAFFVVLYATIFFNPLFAQINSADPEVPFGLNPGYDYGIMPTNLPVSGTYAESQAAAAAYVYWKENLTEACTNGIRVKYDTESQTVSEGIAYGMLLSAYAGDKDLFDGLWEYYIAHDNNHGIMHWKTLGCTEYVSYNGATDAELDAAMALIIASVQWPSSTDPYVYEDEALNLIEAVRLYEIDTATYQTLNGDNWGYYSSCRNPGYFAPAYYREFAKVETDYAAYWRRVADTAESFLLSNRNDTTGLVSNWSDKEAVSNNCNKTGELGILNEYGYDACRSPWRMATDILWHGTDTADAAYDICDKVAIWLNGYENNMKGPLAQDASNPSEGTYRNGAFSTYSLATMVTSDYQESLDSCYTVVSKYGNSTYFNQTIKTITLFMMTGNFWSPDIETSVLPPKFITAATNAGGTVITVDLGRPLATLATSEYNSFVLTVNGSEVSGAFTDISLNGDKSVSLILSSTVVIAEGDVLTLSYTQGDVKSADAVAMEAFSGRSVTNNVGEATLIADCDSASKTKLFTKWYSYNDSDAGGSSTVTPLTTDATLFSMTAGGAANTDSAAKIDYSLYGEEALGYEPFVGLGFAMYSDETAYDLEGSTGISFYHKGDGVELQVILAGSSDEDQFTASVEAHTDWTWVTVSWDKFADPDWDASQVSKFQWKKEDVDNTSGEVWIDEVQINGLALDLPAYEGEAQKTELEATIASAQYYLTKASVGYGRGEYLQEYVDIFEAAIAAAQEVYDDSLATQTEVNVANTTLNTAIETFLASKNTSNITPSTSVNENSIAFNIYPNPVDDLLTVEVDGLQQVIISTLSGQQLQVSTDKDIDVSDLSEGVYLVKVITEDGTISSLIIK